MDDIWGYLGCVDTLIEPFAGTAVCALNAPYDLKNIFLNDYDCHVSNVLRSVLYDPDMVIHFACHPRIEIDLHLIHDYLTAGKPSLRDLLMTGLEAHDAQMAGWWVWGLNNWLGGSWCNCELKTPDALAIASQGDVATMRKKPNDSNKLTEQLVATRRKKPNNSNQLTEQLAPDRYEHIRELVYRCYSRLRDARILYGDFERVLTDTYLKTGSRTGILMDPPYAGTDCTYGDTDVTEDNDTYSRAYDWFIVHHRDPRLRIVFCAQESCLPADLPETVHRALWSRSGGYAQSKKNDRRTEVMLLSEACPQSRGLDWLNE